MSGVVDEGPSASWALVLSAPAACGARAACIRAEQQTVQESRPHTLLAAGHASTLGACEGPSHIQQVQVFRVTV